MDHKYKKSVIAQAVTNVINDHLETAIIQVLESRSIGTKISTIRNTGCRQKLHAASAQPENRSGIGGARGGNAAASL